MASQSSDKIAFTQQKLTQYFGSLLNNGVCDIMAKEIHSIKSPAAQTMIDNWHQSGAKSWAQWVNNSPLNNIRHHNQDTFHELQNYQSQFTENIYAPLSQYLSSHNKFKGTANDLIKRILAIYKHLKLRNIAPTCCMQIDLRSPHDIVACAPLNNEELEWEDEEELYQAGDKDELPPKQCTAAVKLEQESFDDVVLNECVIPNDANYCYKRYEVSLYDNESKVDEAVSNNTIPEFAFDNAPLCMIFNSVVSVRKILHQLCPENMGLISVSFLVYHSSINVYVYVADGKGKLFGSRVFGDDLASIIPLLFENSRVDKLIMDELNSYLQFKPNAVYKQYYLYLVQHAVNQSENKIDDVFQVELDPLFASKLEEIVNSWNVDDNKHIINTIKQCFIENNVNNRYFENHKRKDLIQLLRPYQIKAAAATKIWRAFAEKPLVHHNNEEHELKIGNREDLQEQNQMLLERIQLLEQENDDLKRVIENAMSNASEDDIAMQQIKHDEDQQEDMQYAPDILTNLSALIRENSRCCIQSPLSKNDICLVANRGLDCYYQQGIDCWHQLRMVQEALSVLWILYLCNMYRKLNMQNSLGFI